MKYLFAIKYASFTLFLFSALHYQVYAQISVSGEVTDQNQMPIQGVRIAIEGTTQGTLSDEKGNYQLQVPAGSSTLVFTFVGYKAQTIEVGNQTKIDVSMVPHHIQLGQVVVIGYGSQKRRDITGAVGVVDIDELAKSQSLNLTDRLQGRMAGVSVVTSGQPGSKGNIKIRGTSFFGDNNPLFVIDGILTDDSPNLNPYDIESIQVLKDASAAAIYGSRAANGVVVITTKKGKSKVPEVNFTSQIGFQQIPSAIDVQDNVEFARISNAAHDNSGLPRMTKADMEFDPAINTNWQNEMLSSKAILQDFNVSLASSSDKFNAYFSANNSYNEGTINGSLFDRIGLRVNTAYTPFRRLTIGQHLSVSNVRTSGLPDFIEGNVIPSIFGSLPIIPVYDPFKPNGYGYGQVGIATSYVPNPVAQQNLFKNLDKTTRILGDVYMDVKIIEGLDYHFSLGINSNFTQSKAYNPGGQIRMATVHQSRLSERRGESVEIFLENRLTYARTIGDHNFSVMATHTEQEIDGAFQSSETINGHPKPPYFWVMDASVAPIQSSGSEYSSAIRSYLGRATYNFNDKYLLTGMIRYDGSSKFSRENRWGAFPSVSGGWNIANESFFKPKFISDLKLRVGYGVVGNTSIGNYKYQSLIRSSAATGGVNYNLGSNGDLVIGATRGSLANRDITWEVLKETNIGLDFSLFNGQIVLTADYFIGNMKGLLASVAVPASIGPAEGSEITINAVDMRRRGWEVSLSYKKVLGNFNFNSSLNAWHATNEIEKLPFGVDQFPGQQSTSRLGIPLGQLFLTEYMGIYTSQEQIDADGVTINGQVPEVGDARYRDVNSRDDNGKLTDQPDGNVSFDDDRQIWGNPIPAIEYGFNFGADWKGFDVYLFLQGVTRRDVYNSIYADLNTSHTTNYTADFDPFIDGKGTDPRPINRDVANNFPSTRFVENGAYLRLKNLQIGYTIPWARMRTFRIYLSGQNLFVVTKYRGMDPEFEGGVFESGIDPLAYPQVRTISAGVNITF